MNDLWSGSDTAHVKQPSRIEARAARACHQNSRATQCLSRRSDLHVDRSLNITYITTLFLARVDCFINRAVAGALYVI